MGSGVGGAPGRSRTPRRPARVVVPALALVVLALACVLGVLVADPANRPAGDTPGGLLRRAAGADHGPGWRTADHRAAAAAARRTVLAVLDVDHRDMRPRVEAVLASATGDLAREYADGAGGLARAARRTRLVSSGEVVALGVAGLTGGSAVVLVAADSTVSSTGTGGERQSRRHRMRLRLVREDGRWLTAGLELVR